MLACSYSKIDSFELIVKYLLDTGKIDVNLQDKNGNTALMIASRYSKTYSSELTFPSGNGGPCLTIKYLLDAGVRQSSQFSLENVIIEPNKISTGELELIVKLQKEIINEKNKIVDTQNIFKEAYKAGYNVVEATILSYYPCNL